MTAMHCGPVRHHMAPHAHSALRSLDLIVHHTDHDAPEGQHIQTIFRELVDDQARTRAICDDIHNAVSSGRNCLVLTRWTDHLNAIVGILTTKNLTPLVLHGQMGTKARIAVTDQLSQPRADGGLLLVATASLLGEGFDCPPLDTLFLAFPIKFKGSVVQYVGRILRPTDTKIRVEVHDYLDIFVPALVRMHNERRKAYATLGFESVTTKPAPTHEPPDAPPDIEPT